MKNITKIVITLVIGGTVYSVSQADLVKNFSKDTGLSHEQAQEYVDSISEDDLVPFTEIGDDHISAGQETLKLANEIDCANYYYEWETTTMSCESGKAQLIKFSKSSITLGKSYKVLDTENADELDISNVITNIDRLNQDFDLEVITVLLDSKDIQEMKTTNSYNKALLKSALESE